MTRSHSAMGDVHHCQVTLSPDSPLPSNKWNYWQSWKFGFFHSFWSKIQSCQESKKKKYKKNTQKDVKLDSRCRTNTIIHMSSCGFLFYIHFFSELKWLAFVYGLISEKKEEEKNHIKLVSNRWKCSAVLSTVHTLHDCPTTTTHKNIPCSSDHFSSIYCLLNWANYCMYFV